MSSRAEVAGNYIRILNIAKHLQEGDSIVLDGRAAHLMALDLQDWGYLANVQDPQQSIAGTYFRFTVVVTNKLAQRLKYIQQGE